MDCTPILPASKWTSHLPVMFPSRRDIYDGTTPRSPCSSDDASYYLEPELAAVDPRPRKTALSCPSP